MQLKHFSCPHTANAGAHHDAYLIAAGGPSAEKKQKVLIEGLNGFELDGDTPLDTIMGKNQFPEMLSPYRHVPGRYNTFLMAFSSNAHASGRDLSYNQPLKLVTNYRVCIFYYEDEG